MCPNVFISQLFACDVYALVVEVLVLKSTNHLELLVMEGVCGCFRVIPFRFGSKIDKQSEEVTERG